MILAFIGTTELICIVIVVFLLFGGKKLPELMRGLGSGVREFKKGMDGVKDELKEPQKERKESTENPQNSQPKEKD